MDLRRLRHLIAIAEHGNFARAAAAVGLTQPALSRSLQTLEEALGARLLDRSRSGVQPTVVGQQLIDQARGVLTQVREMERSMQLVIGMAGGLLRIGAGPFPAEISVGIAVARLVQQHPGVRVDLCVDDWPALTPRLLAGELDVVVAEASQAVSDGRLEVEPLANHAGVFFCRAGHPLDGRACITFDELRAYPLVMASIPERLVPALMPLASNAGEPPATRNVAEVRVTTASLARQIVLESDAVSAALPLQIADDVARGRIALLQLASPALHTAYGIIRQAHRTPAPATLAFIDILREVEAGI